MKKEQRHQYRDNNRSQKKTPDQIADKIVRSFKKNNAGTCHIHSILF